MLVLHLAAGLWLSCTSLAPQEPETAPELGRIHWQRDLDAALAQSRASTRPVAVLFQEVPG